MKTRTPLRTQLIAGLLFPLQERFKCHDTVRIRRRMEDSQWWAPERIEAFRIGRLRSFLADVGRHVPYYHDRFAEQGFHPESIRQIADLQSLPLLTKAIIREENDRLHADDARGLARFNTGGSSGEPLIFFIGKERVAHDVAAKWRATRWWDVDIGDPEIVLWGSPIELGSQDRLRQIRDRLLRTQLLPAFEMSPDKVKGFLDTIRQVRPRMLFGYPSAFAHLATQAEAQGLIMSNLGIKVAFVTSERLYDHQRELIERVFGCPVANGYGGRDAGFIAHQCPSGGMHITAEDIIVEIVDPAGQSAPGGEAGEIVVTHLATRDFPFIRYRTGDIGVLDNQTCICGRGLPLLKEIQGRSTDFVVAADGTIIHGLALIYVLRDLPGVTSFKIVQESRALTRVWIEAGDGFMHDDIDRIENGFKRRLGDDVSIVIDLVDQIPPDTSGKFRYVMSHVAEAHATQLAPTPRGIGY
jgi:phenylacetate-CoA ligase